MLRPGEVEDALEQCLLRLQQGEDAEACLAGYPEIRDELAPLLQVAQQLHASAPPPPDCAAALARGRGRFMRLAAQQRAAYRRIRRAPWTYRLIGALSPLLRRGLAGTLAAAALIIILLLGTSAIASANSLPGDALYPIKLAAESVQIALTFNQESRAAVQHTIEARRVEEAQRVVKERRVARISFSGVVTAYDGSTLTAAGLTVHVTAGTRLAGPLPAPGLTVRISAYSRSDGALTGELIETLTAPTPSPQPTRTIPAPTASPALKAGYTPVLQGVAARPSSSPSHTFHPWATATASPSATALPTASCTLAATSTMTPSLAPSASPSPPPATAEPPREVEVRFAGLINSLGPEIWNVAGVLVRITPATEIDEQSFRAEVGAWVQVKGVPGDGGYVLARKIVVERGPQQEPAGELVEFQGVIEAVSPGHWMVSGQNLEIEASTAITGEAAIGRQAEVQARRRPNGILVAISILVREPEDIPVEFAGIIEQIASDHWVISSHRIVIDSQTTIQGTATVGARAQVRGLELADGSIRALAILVQAAPTPSATATPAPPTATPALPTATSDPSTATPNPSSTPPPTPTETSTPAPVTTEAAQATVASETSAPPTATVTPGSV